MIVLLSVLSLPGWSKDGQPPGASSAPLVPLAALHGNARSGAGRHATWTRDPAELAILLDGVFFGGAEPADDPLRTFRGDRHVAIVARLGRRPTGGYGVEFAGAVSEGRRLTVTLRESTPPRERFVTQALTYPVGLFLLPWRGETELTVVWSRPEAPAGHGRD